MLSSKGLIHIYYGDGKGKTSASIGLTIRCLGAGYKCVFLQFMKEGSSSEFNVLRKLSDIYIFHLSPIGSIFNLSRLEEEEVSIMHHNNFNSAILSLSSISSPKIFVLDEVFGAISRGLFNEEILLDYLHNKGDEEVLMTGRSPSDKIIELSDYVTCIKKIRHPFDLGVSARVGIEK